MTQTEVNKIIQEKVRGGCWLTLNCSRERRNDAEEAGGDNP